MRTRKLIHYAGPLALVFLLQCGAKLSLPFNQARRDFKTDLIDPNLRDPEPPETPPDFIDLIQYETELGPMYAYLVVPETDSDELRPAVIWIHGGFGNGIGSTVWEEQDPKNDQSGSAFWKRGFITMYPALRGGSGNPGVQEQFLGEVDDVIAAGKYLAERPDVDPARIYLGGHSTGGTLVLLVAASTKMFRAVVAFGPVADIRSYGSYGLNFSLKDKAEWQYRSPIFWLRDIQCPTWVYEGEREPSNFDVLQEFKKVKTNQRILFFSEKGYDHFSILAPGTKKMADRIFMDSEWDPTFDTHPY